MMPILWLANRHDGRTIDMVIRVMDHRTKASPRFIGNDVRKDDMNFEVLESK